MICKEEWKDIEGFEGLYQISTFGRVKSLVGWCGNKNIKKYIHREKILKTKPKKNGYLVVTLRYQNVIKYKSIHRLVAKTFLPNPNNYPVVNHIDGNKTNNNINNLEWFTHLYNNHYGKRIERIQNKLSKKVYQYDYNNNLIKEWKSASEIQRELGYCQTSICSCCNNKRISAYGFLWKYK